MKLNEDLIENMNKEINVFVYLFGLIFIFIIVIVLFDFKILRNNKKM